MNKRGYLFTVLSYMLIFSLFLLAYNFHNIAQEEKWDGIDLKSMDKIAGIHDDVGTTLEDAFNLQISFTNSSGSTIVTMNESMGSRDYAADLAEYVNYLTGDYQSIVGANISLGDDGNFKIFPVNLNISYGNTQKDSMTIYGTDITSFSVAIMVDEQKERREVDRESGDLPFYLEIVDGNGDPHWPAWTHSNNRNRCNSYFANFTGGTTLNISMGGCEGYPNVVQINTTGPATAVINITTGDDYLGNISIMYDQPLHIHDMATGANKTAEPVLVK